MKDIDKLCPSCMCEKGLASICPCCGFNTAAYGPPLHHLPPGSILYGKYVVGKAIGEGGFGITYIGIDLNLDMRVAIKEYYPAGFVTRNTTVSDTIAILGNEKTEFFNVGKEKIIEEARTLAHFNNENGIVSVRDFFSENGTAYIVMEYIDGFSLKDYLLSRGGKLPVNEALELVKPILNSLAVLHKEGIIHRDISPDNIMINKNGKVMLIDFGAAKNVGENAKKSLSIQLKHGYAPAEQYRTHGEQGPWTDVYALCATVYRMITGYVPDAALERLKEDKLVLPSQMGIQISRMQEQALINGLRPDYRSRTQNIDFLCRELYNTYPSPYNQDNPSSTIPAHSSAQSLKPGTVELACILIFCSMVIAILGIFVAVHFVQKIASSFQRNPVEAPTITYTATPAVNKYNTKYIDTTGRTIDDVADQSGMTLEEFLEIYRLPKDMPGDTYESAAFYTMPVSKVSEVYGLTFEDMKEQLRLPDTVAENDKWGDVEGEIPLGVYIGGEEYLDQFKEYYELGDNVTAETKWKNVRTIVDIRQKEEREQSEDSSTE